MISRVIGKTILSPNLTEFARPVSQDSRAAFICKVGLARAIRPVVASAHEPSTVKLVLSRRVHTEGTLLKWRLLALAPDELAAPDERVVDSSPQRLPAHRGIHTVQACDEVRPQFVVASRIGEPEIDVGGFVKVPVAAEMCHHADITFPMRLEHQLIPCARIATKQLPGCGKENAFRKRDDPLHRNTRIVD